MEETALITSDIKHKRRQELIESLAAMRNAENSDVTLICAGKEFFAHKSVLKGSSPYFVAMFQCGLEEAKSGRVFFQDMDPEALELILDYLYLGTVDKIQTIEQVKKVLESSHLMQLEHLVTYCYDAITEQLSLENFVDIWNIADTYDSRLMLTQVFNFLMVAVSEVVHSPLFTCLSYEQLKAFISFNSVMVICCDEILLVIIAWLRKDLQERARYAKELFEFVDVKHLSKTSVKMLLEDEEVMKSCEEIQNGLKDIGIAVAYLFPRSSSVITQLESLIHTKLGTVRIIFHSEFQVYNLILNCKSRAVELVNYVQEFELDTMSWLPAITLPSKTNARIISSQNCITLQGDTLRTITHSYIFTGLVLFVTKATQHQDPSFQYLNRMGENTWVKIRNPNTSSGVMVASSKYVYIVGTSPIGGDPVIKFNVLQYLTELDWNVLPSPHIPDETKVHFFVYEDKLSGFYYTKDELVRIMFEHEQGKWCTKVLPIGPPGIIDVSCVCCGRPDECYVFVSTVDADPLTPNFLWDPESGKWAKLPLPKGKCVLEDTDKLHKLWRVC